MYNVHLDELTNQYNMYSVHLQETLMIDPNASPALTPVDTRWTVRHLRLEGLALLVAAAATYSWLPTWSNAAWGWAAFAAAFLLPDLAMLGYLKSARVGALAYNLAHTEWLPATVLGLGLWSHQASLVSAAIVWLAHIGFDRALGYGLKYPNAFGDTHLGRIGRPAGDAPTLAPRR